MTAGDADQLALLGDVSDIDFARHLLAELHDDLLGKVTRFRMLANLGRKMGPHGTMIFGGHAAGHSWLEARSSFVHGNFAATVLLCQGLVEHLLAAYLHGGLMVDDLPDRIQFRETLHRCRERDVISDQDVADLERLMELRNPLSHFRHPSDNSNFLRRSSEADETAEELMRRDATFAIGLAVRLLSKPPFRIG